MKNLPPMITAKALGGIPQFLLLTEGERAMARAFQRSNLPYRFIEARDGYIPEVSIAAFVKETARSTGTQNVSLLWAQHLSVLDYGAWGRYVLAAETLGGALRRAEQISPLHATASKIRAKRHANIVQFSFALALRNTAAYLDLAISSIGVMLSVVRHYLGSGWVPTRIAFDTPPPVQTAMVEDTFSCPVQWRMPSLCVEFPASSLGCPRPQGSQRTQNRTTLADVLRERIPGPPRNISERVSEIVRLNLDEGFVGIDIAAENLDMGVRQLQRHLASEGIGFRKLTNMIRMQRGIELLQDSSLSIASIAATLGYENSNNFSRAFRKLTSQSPLQYRSSRVRE